MWARVARFDGDPADLDDRIAAVRNVVNDPPPWFEGTRFLMLVDRESGGALSIALFETEEALRHADALLSQGSGHGGTRTGVEVYEVPLHRL
jgi:hypothetical protein